MRKITIMNNLESKEVIASVDNTPAELLEQNGVNAGHATISVNGEALRGGRENLTLRELGFDEAGDSTIYVQAVSNTKGA